MSRVEQRDEKCFYTDGSTSAIIHEIPQILIPQANELIIATRFVIIGGSIGGLAAAACLRAAGFRSVTVFERNPTSQQGAGISLDDASVAILRGLRIIDEDKVNRQQLSIQKMRWFEDRLANGTMLCRQPLPYSAVLYSELLNAIKDVIPPESIVSDRKVARLEYIENSSVRVHFENADIPPVECDAVIAADGASSTFRTEVCGLNQSPFPPSSAADTNCSVRPHASDLRYAGYTAWRGVVQKSDLPPDFVETLNQEYPLLSNCLYYFISPGTESPRQSAVLYDIGKGLLNWLLYEESENSTAESGFVIIQDILPNTDK